MGFEGWKLLPGGVPWLGFWDLGICFFGFWGV